MLGGSKAHHVGMTEAWLVDPTQTRIQRHVKVRAGANPFDPQWSAYFESRKRLKKSRQRR